MCGSAPGRWGCGPRVVPARRHSSRWSRLQTRWRPGDGVADVFAPHDNAYLSVHRGGGEMFDAASIFALATMVAGVRFLFEDGTAQQGYADDEESENQAHFTNSAPAIADLDGDGKREPGGPGVGPERVADRS